MKLLIRFSILLFICNCCSSKNEMNNSLNELFKHYGVKLNNKVKVIVIVPLEGCNKCISPAINFSKKNLGNEAVYFILTTSYKKITESYYSSDDLLNKNLIEDNKLIAQKLNLTSPIAPKVYFVKRNKIERIEDMSKTYDKETIYGEINEFLSEVQ